MILFEVYYGSEVKLYWKNDKGNLFDEIVRNINDY